jgi:hypothetical protein
MVEVYLTVEIPVSVIITIVITIHFSPITEIV